jgi:hypothetical protein
MPRAEFEAAIPGTKRPQTHALDRAATGIGIIWSSWMKLFYGFLLSVQEYIMTVS